ncbi:hypothetical protein [Paenibacillus sp.]|uniref:hypothetical protein n=1 Tax=Paenibacillus sp. TaxID=58172 RepID=UPI002D316052|nr:hypothetical protein [Paenibacillus sp.]HZG58275.1 hypothetical protein [Paenibacillus sp.]
MIRNEQGGADTLIVTLFVCPLLLFLCFAGVPFFVFMMKGTHLNVVANHALKEAESIGYVSPAVIAAATERLAALGLEPVTRGGITYPSFAGSTAVKVLRDEPNAAITVVVTYPAPGVGRLLALVGGGAAEEEGMYRVVLHGKSEAYE